MGNMSMKCLLYFGLLFLALSFVIHYYRTYYIQASSVWCLNRNNVKTCTFKHICYNPSQKTFEFELNTQSVIMGITNKEIKNLQLSSVYEHNMFFMNLTFVSNIQRKNVIIIDKAVIFARFKIDNIMHVIHDDLIPLYFTLEELCRGDTYCFQQYVIVFHDNYDKGPFYSLYAVFSKLLLLNEAKNNICFTELSTGVSNTSVWFQYGFKKSQGPVQTDISFYDINRFSEFITQKLNIPREGNCSILLSRKINRRITNELEVVGMIKHVFNTSAVSIMDLSTNSIYDMIEQSQCAELLVGMHGSAMIFSIFLKPRSVVIEIFPYGIQPDAVSFVQPLAKLRGASFIYKPWVNTLKNNSMSFPNNPPALGGIYHLPKFQQEEIKNSEKVPAVECCENPNYLYHMYQDTRISSDFMETLKEAYHEAMVKRESRESEIRLQWLQPALIWNLSCNTDADLVTLSWPKPYNVVKEEIIYEVVVYCETTSYLKAMLTSEIFLSFNKNMFDGKIKIWISSYLKTQNDQRIKSDSYHECLV